MKNQLFGGEHMGFVWFMLGLLSGGCIGTAVMCLFQINRLNEYEKQIREIEEKVKKN